MMAHVLPVHARDTVIDRDLSARLEKVQELVHREPCIGAIRKSDIGAEPGVEFRAEFFEQDSPVRFTDHVENIVCMNNSVHYFPLW
jgi:hypothetical protein